MSQIRWCSGLASFIVCKWPGFSFPAWLQVGYPDCFKQTWLGKISIIALSVLLRSLWITSSKTWPCRVSASLCGLSFLSLADNSWDLLVEMFVIVRCLDLLNYVVQGHFHLKLPGHYCWCHVCLQQLVRLLRLHCTRYFTLLWYVWQRQVVNGLSAIDPGVVSL